MVWDSSDGNLEFADNAEINMGAANDFRIYHDGGTASLLRAKAGDQLGLHGDTVWLRNAANNESLAKFNNGGSAQLFFNNSDKLQTKSDGVNITGELECDTLDVDGDVDFDGGQLVFDASNNRLDFADDAKATFGDVQDFTILP